MFQKYKSETGNALFLILIAVGLFAALSYAVTQSGRGGGHVDRETNMLVASALLQNTAMLEQTVARMVLGGGCTENQISFQYDIDGDGDFNDSDEIYYAGTQTYHNTFAPTDLSCHVFHPNGGGLAVFEMPAEAQASVAHASFTPPRYVGNYNWRTVSWDPGTGQGELMVVAGIGNATLCSTINDVLDIDNEADGTPPFRSGSHIHADLFNGAYDVTNPSWWHLPDNFSGKNAGCFDYTDRGANTYIYYQILLTR